MSCGCNQIETLCQPTEPCLCKVRLNSDCITVSGATNYCLGIDDNLILTDYLSQLDDKICEKIATLTNFIALKSIGTGAQVYKGIDVLGKKEIRSLKSLKPELVIAQTTDEITFDLNIPPVTPPDGSETKLQDGTNTTVSGNGTVTTPYAVNVNFPTINGSETKLINGTNTVISGNGTIATPYTVNVDGSETKLSQGTNVTITGNGTIATPYIINASTTFVDNRVFEKIDEGNGTGIIIKDRVSANYGSIGLNAVDLSRSTAVSSTVGATGADSFAAGKNVTASGSDSIAMGGGFSEAVSAKATGDGSIAIGRGTVASASRSLAIGTDASSPTTASGVGAFAFNGGTASGSSSFSISAGGTSISSGDFSMAIGTANASGVGSHAFGIGVTAKSFYETVLGRYNESSATPLSTTTWNSLDKLFSIGNGTSAGTTSDALILLKNGLATLPSITNTLIESASGKAIITKEYLSRQKEITTNYTLVNADNDQTIFINNGATPITITINTTVTTANFGVGFIQEGTGDVTFVGTGVSLTNPVGLKSKGQGYATYIERKLATNTFYLCGDTKA